MFKKVIVALALVVCPAWSAHAAHPLITDDTGTQGKGKYQVELNGTVSRDEEVFDGVQTREDGAEIAASFSAGLSDNIDLVIGAPLVWSRIRENGALTGDENGLGDLALELKLRFFEQTGFSLAVKPGITLPTGNEHRGLGNGKVSYGVTIIATQELEPVTFHLNAAYTHNEFKLDADKETNRSDIWHGSVAATYEIIKDFQLVANVGLESNGDRGASKTPAFILGGAIYTMTENLDLDLGVKGGLNGPEADISYLAGIAYRF